MEIKGGAHHVIDPVLLHHAMHIVRERSTGKNGHVLATVRFRIQRHGGFLHEVGVRSVDAGQVRALRVVVVRRWDVRIGLHARRHAHLALWRGGVGRAGVARAVGVAQGGVRQAEQVLIFFERSPSTWGTLFTLPRIGLPRSG